MNKKPSANQDKLASFRVHEIMDRAAKLPLGQGLRLQFPNAEGARTFRWRCYNLRNKVQRESRKAVGPDNPGFGKSPWDDLVFLISDDHVLWIGSQGALAPSVISVGGPPK